MIKRQNNRLPSSQRGYNAKWRRIRIEVLKAWGIPKRLWPQYDVDHNPPYDPAVEPDHRKYNLVPRLHSDHSRKTAREDNGFGNKTRKAAPKVPAVINQGTPRVTEGGIDSLGPGSVNRASRQENTMAAKGKGVSNG